MTLKSVCGAICAAFLAACSTTPHISNKSISYNDAVELDSNIGVLKNAVRAAHRMPLTYTSIQNLTYKGRLKGSFGADITLGDNSGKVPLSFSVNPDDEASIAFERLIGTEFYEKVINGVGKDEFAGYLQQGWPLEFVFVLLVERMELSPKVFCKLYNKRSEATLTKYQIAALESLSSDRKCASGNAAKSKDIVVDNDPDTPADFFAFTALARLARDSFEIKSKSQTDDKPILFDLSAERFFSIYEHLPEEVKGGQNGYYFDQSNGKFSIKKKSQSQSQTISFSECSENENNDLSFFTTGEDKTPKSCASFPLRSPDAVAYYLGELLRAQAIAQKKSKVCDAIGELLPQEGVTCDNADELYLHEGGYAFGAPSVVDGYGKVLFKLNMLDFAILPFARRNTPNGFFKFKFLDGSYIVPEAPDNRGRTMQAVTMVLQLLGRRQTAAETVQINTIDFRNVN